MGNCCKGPVYPQVPNARIESSLKVKREFPKPCSQKKWIVRDDSSAFGKYRGLDELFDNIDCILHVCIQSPKIMIQLKLIIISENDCQPLHLLDDYHRDRHRSHHPHGDLWPDEQPLDALGAALHLWTAALHAGPGLREEEENHSTPGRLEQVK